MQDTSMENAESLVNFIECRRYKMQEVPRITRYFFYVNYKTVLICNNKKSYESILLIGVARKVL